MKIIKTFILLYCLLFCSVVSAAPDLVADDNGCYFWNGDRNCLAITYLGYHCVVAKLDSCRFESYNGVTTVNATLYMLTPTGDSVQNLAFGNFFSNGVFKFVGGDYSRVSIGNVNNVIATLTEHASQ